MTQSLSLCVVLPSFRMRSGGEESLLDLAIGLSRMGWRVSLASIETRPNSDALRRFRRRIQRSGQPLGSFYLSREFDCWSSPSVRWKDILTGRFSPLSARFIVSPNRLADRLRFRKFDVVITSQLFSYSGVRKIREVSGATLVFNHAADPAGLKQSYLARKPLPDEDYERYLSLFDVVLFQSKNQQLDFHKMHPSTAVKTQLLTPWVDEEKLKQVLIGKPQNALTYPSWAVHEIAIFGPVTPRKGQLHLLKAFLDVLHTAPNVHLTICGRVEQSAYVLEILSFIQLNRLEAHVSLVGHRPDYLNFLADADIVILASDSEGVPRILREALYLGIPIVATDLPGVRELLGDDAVLVRPGDTDGLVQQIRYLIERPEEAKASAMEARSLFFRNHHPSKFAQDIALFAAMLEGSRPTVPPGPGSTPFVTSGELRAQGLPARNTPRVF